MGRLWTKKERDKKRTRQKCYPQCVHNKIHAKPQELKQRNYLLLKEKTNKKRKTGVIIIIIILYKEKTINL